MKKILLIGTGGTIASDVTEDGLAPELTSEQLLNHLPAISSICDVECIQLLNLDSTNMRPEHWLDMVRASGKTMTAMMALSSPMVQTPWLIQPQVSAI